MPSHLSIKPDSRDYHRKGQTNLRLSDEGVAMLRALASHYGLGTSNVVEMLVRTHVHDKGIRVQRAAPPKRRGR